MSHSSNSEEVSCLAAEMRAINQSHTQLLEQNQKLMESNSEIMKQVLHLSKDLQEIKLQLAKALNQPPVTPAPSAPANQGLTGTPSPAPQATSSPQLPQQSPQQPQQQTHQLASRQSGSITSGLSSKSPGVVPPAMFSPGAPSPSATARPTPAAPAQVPSRGFISTPERGIENITPPVTAAGPSSFAGTPTKPLGSAEPKVSPQPQGMVKQDITDRQRQALMAATAPPAGSSPTAAGGSPAAAAQPKTQFSGVTPGASSATSKPSQAFGNFSFSPSTVKPAPSFGKPATNSQSPFAGFSFGMSNTSTPSTSTISAAGVFKPAVSSKTTLQLSTGGSAGGSPVVFGKPDLTQDSRSSSPGYPGFYASPKAIPGASPQSDQTVPSSRKPGQSPLAKDTASPKAADTPKSVSFKTKVEDDDVIYISMTQPSPEQRARAEKLMLPGGFYLYEDAPPCKGCIGCIEDLDIDSLYQTGGDWKASAPVVRPKEPTSSVFGATGGSSASFGSLSINAPGGSLFGGGDTGGGISFASLAANQSEGFGQPFASEKPFAFANAGAPVFGASASRDNDENDDSHGGDDEYDPHYEPIITLPDIGSISTGEEDEEEMFRHRAKLFRFDRDSKAWKERGVGDIKILRNPKTGGARILMRRDQILKLCANHSITPDMVLKPMMVSETAWVWFAVDFSEEEAKNEQLAVKFKHVEDAKRFKEAFLEAQKLLQVKEEDNENQKEEEEKKEEEKENRKSTESKTPSVTEANPQLTSLLMGTDKVSAGKGTSTDLKLKFAKKPGSWDCDACYINNSAESTACVACVTPKPGSEPKSSANAGATATGGAVGGAFVVPTGFTFGTKSSSANTGFGFGQTQTLTAGNTTDSSAAFKVPAGFSFTGKSSDSKSSTPDSTTTDGATSFSLSSHSTSSAGFVFGAKKGDIEKPKENEGAAKASSTGFSFGAEATKAAPSTSSGATTPGGTVVTDKFTFGSHGSPMPQFSFGGIDKPKPDAGLSFGVSSMKPASGETKECNPFTSSQKVTADTPSSSSSSTPSKPNLTLNDLAKSQGSSFTFRMDLNAVTAKSPVKSPGGAKSPGVGRSPKTSFSRGGRTMSGGSVDEEVEQGEDIYFEPIFQMPDDYEVKTGEEGEEVKFSHRAKLYRYDGESKQWKERGLGDIKVLYNSEDHKYRIVMRREQVFKVCANHYITPLIELLPNAGSDRSWVWSAMDASDGTVQNERLAVRFKTPDSAKEFKEAVDKAKEDLDKGQGKEDGAKKDDSTDSKSEEPVIRSCDPNLSSALADAMKSSSESGAASSAVQPNSTSEEPVIKSSVPNLSSALADAIKSSAESDAASSTVQAIGGEVNPEEERDIHFQPIVKLPEKVDLVTGEEQEVAEFVGRGKLYRFDGGAKQWKERGVGDMKIMKDEDRDVYRIVMRRDQIHKVCANHYIMSSMVLHPMSGSDRAWVWHAMDAADGEPTSEQLAVKFKEPSIATAFKEKFEEAQAKIRLREAASGDDIQKGSQEDGDVTASGTASSSTSQQGDGVATATPSSQGD